MTAVEMASVTVDHVFHASRLRLLRSLGVDPGPTDGIDVSAGQGCTITSRAPALAYLESCSWHSQAKQAYLSFGGKPKSAWGPLEPLRLLSEEGKVRFVERCPDDAFADSWVMEHETQSWAYPRVPFFLPCIGSCPSTAWYAHRWGHGGSRWRWAEA